MNQYKSLFEQQSYNDALAFYEETVSGGRSSVVWDYVILTASNEAQAGGYREEIQYRLDHGRLPKTTHYAVLSDTDGKRIGSGGATFNAIKYIKEDAGRLDGLRILCIHSGGDSKRVPQYSACGKLFSPVPRVLLDGRRSTLFDEFMIGMSTVAPRISEGMLVCSGDVLLLFNALQIDFYSTGAAALSIKEDVETGKDHGVYLKDENGNVGYFLHKQSPQTLSSLGAVDGYNHVDIDTGSVVFSSEVLNDLYSLIDTENKFASFVNERARISFYADFLYPLASGSTLADFYEEKPEGDYTAELRECREKLWNVLHQYKMKLIRLSPASFIHFGTTHELLSLMTREMKNYSFLGWSGNVGSNVGEVDYAVSNSYVSRRAQVKRGCYIEDSNIHHDSVVGENCVLSGVTLNGETVPDNTVLHCLKLSDKRFVVRCYGVEDNPKDNKLFGKEIKETLWTANIYPVCNTAEEALRATLAAVIEGKDFSGDKMSLMTSFNSADVSAILPWQEKLRDKIKAESVLQAIDDGICAETLHIDMNDRIIAHLLNEAGRTSNAELSGFSRKMRIYYYIYKLTANVQMSDKCFKLICDTVLENALDGTGYNDKYKIAKDEISVRLPVRVNFGGGWSDTPPYCIEHGGTVLNAAVSFGGKLPIEVTLKKTDKPVIILASTDIGSYKEFDSIDELCDCTNTSDAFSLHKAALIACGIIPREGKASVAKICERLGGGFYMNTRVVNIPKGSGLGTSSILAGACAKALYLFMGETLSENDLYNRVLCMEQLMSTGGGWQDQVGGLSHGIKMVTSQPGLCQNIKCTPINIQPSTLKEFYDRFCLIYTGQRRLARNLLREVVGNYIENNPVSLGIHYDVQRLAVLMRFELEKGNIDGFAELLNESWETLKRLDAGCTNTCIDQIFNSIEDLICGRMICGAGGGGFIQVVLKKGVTKQALNERLHDVFADSGVDVWESELYCKEDALC